MPDDMIIANVTGMIFAAFDTSCTAMSWILYAFAKYPEWQKKCREEVEEVLGSDADPTWNQLKELKCCEMFIKECLRYWPPAPLIGRINQEPLSLDGNHIPKNTWLEVGIWSTHHNPEVGRECW